MKVSAPHRGWDLRSGYALPSSHPLCGKDSKPGRTPLIVRGNLSRRPGPALKRDEAMTAPLMQIAKQGAEARDLSRVKGSVWTDRMLSAPVTVSKEVFGIVCRPNKFFAPPELFTLDAAWRKARQSG